MRKFLSIVLVVALAFLFSGTLVISHPLSNLAIESLVNLTSFQSTNSDRLESDGICFEILMPESVLFMPSNQPNAITYFKLGIRITNQTAIPLRFSWFDTLRPELVGSDRLSLPLGGGRDVTIPPTESDYPIVLPEKNLTLFRNGSLFWVNNRLQLSISDGFGGSRNFNNLKPGVYELRFLYNNSNVTTEIFDIEIGKFRILERFWIGHLSSQFVKFFVKPIFF